MFDKPVYVSVDFNFTSIASYVDNVGIGPHGYCYIMDRKGDIVYHPQQQLIYTGLKEEDTLSLKGLADGVYPGSSTIKPLIENAIYHGINWMVDEGVIRITARDEGDDVVFLVADNGAGMTKEQCEAILKKERTDSSGIGIKNVNDRIKIYFGDSYGIEIESELDVGTTIKIRFPKIREGEYDGK